MRRKSTEPLTAAEWRIMKTIWELGACTSSEVHQDVGTKHDWAINTVRTMMSNLVDKGFLSVREQGNKYTYKPTIPASRMLKQAADTLLDRSLEETKGELICYMVKKTKLSPNDIHELRLLLDQYDPPKRE